MQRNVKFVRMSVEGFRSYALSTEFALDNPGLTIVKGPNGAGKTTKFSALCWVLYRVNLNDTNNEKVQTWVKRRPKGYRGTRVVLDFTVNNVCYRVARHLNFKGTTKGLKGDSRLMLFRNTETFNFTEGDMVGEEHHKGDQQGYINRLMGMDARTFLNSILFGQRMQRLVSADNDEKRKLFEILFEVEFIEQAKAKAKDEKSQLDVKLSKSTTEHSACNDEIDNLLEALKEKKEILENFESNKKIRIDKLKLDIKQLQEDRWAELDKKKKLTDSLPKGKKVATVNIKQEYEDASTKYFSTKDNNNDLETSIKQSRRELETIEDNIKKFEESILNVSDVCPYCNAKLSKIKVGDVKRELRLKLAREMVAHDVLDANLGDKVKKQDEIKVTLTTLEKDYLNKKNMYENAPVKPDDAKAAIERCDYCIESIDKQLDAKEADIKHEEEVQPPKINLNALNDDIDVKRRQAKKLELEIGKDAAKLGRIEWWISKGFSSGGLKAFVFSAMLNQLNVMVRKYAHRLGYSVKFSVDLSKASKPFTTECYIGDIKVDYDELSGGQKQRLDIALAFAMHDLVSASSNMNILIMDEVFESLDEEGIEEVFDLIRIKSGAGKSVYIITHSMIIDNLGARSMIIRQDEEKISYVE